ncbi:glutamate ABC transporter substrate-binding protein [Actinocrispum wychmicini]|uniref:Polar amino acid transport system substrate-binding protein n=1 Tax=Actinocrispum wychmicini TaxID=1213861 RepID=A0A4R2KEY8_9PSEU|nr:glutamate ABC transporter substrate-binding protein [Actinocrispum wychmicini]TCO65115.1 polar amino acid transport system substrate-binding protein [Actinocrispum wychmicini]
MRRVALLALATLALAGCGGPGRPVDLANVTTVDAPQPEEVRPAEPPKPGAQAPNCGDPTASLRPNGLAVTPNSTMAKIRDRGRLIAGVDQNTYLFGFRNPASNSLEGFDIDMARQVAKALFGDENKVQYKVITSKDREDVLVRGDVDIVVRTYTINCDREQKVAFSSVYYDTGQRVLVDKNSPAKGMDDLGGKRVCANAGSTSIDAIAKNPAKPVAISVPNWSDCLVLLQQGQVAAVSTDEPILAGMAAQDPNLKIVGPKLTVEPYGIGIPKANTDMVRYVNAVLEKIRGDGSWQQSYDQWVGGRTGVQATPPAPKYRD